jgi:hypothetical protein
MCAYGVDLGEQRFARHDLLVGFRRIAHRRHDLDVPADVPFPRFALAETRFRKGVAIHPTHN